jgi:hypothetical protein
MSGATSLYATNKFTPQPASIHPKNEFGHGKQEQVSDKRNSYAHILYTILKNAPDQSMTLQDIYESFKHVTTGKAQKEARSWKNSIRHVLSVNDVRIYPCNFEQSIDLHRLSKD